MDYNDLVHIRGVNKWFLDLVTYYLEIKNGKWELTKKWLEKETRHVVTGARLRGEQCWSNCKTESGIWLTRYRILWGTVLTPRGRMSPYWYFKQTKCMRRGEFVRSTGLSGKREWDSYIYHEWGKITAAEKIDLTMQIKLHNFLKRENKGDRVIISRPVNSDTMGNNLGEVQNFAHYDDYEGRFLQLNERGTIVREIWLG